MKHWRITILCAVASAALGLMASFTRAEGPTAAVMPKTEYSKIESAPIELGVFQRAADSSKGELASGTTALACVPGCLYCNCGTPYENNCPAAWLGDGECDCGCQWCDTDCGGDCSGQGCGPQCDYTIYADSCPDNGNTVALPFCFSSNPGRVFFTPPPSCGSLDRAYMDPRSVSGCTYYVDPVYTPCETEYLTETITADPTTTGVANQTRTVCLLPRVEICTGQIDERCVVTFAGGARCPVSALVTMTVNPPSCGTMDPTSCVSTNICDFACDFCWYGTTREGSCDPTWERDGECDCGCQFTDEWDCGCPPQERVAFLCCSEFTAGSCPSTQVCSKFLIDNPAPAPDSKLYNSYDQNYSPPCPIDCYDFTVAAPHVSPARSTCGASNDCDIFDSDNADHVYEVTIPNEGCWRFSLCDALYDTKMCVGTTCCGCEVGYEDDGCGVQSEIQRHIPSGIYYVTVDGHDAACGNYVLQVDQEVRIESSLPPNCTIDARRPHAPGNPAALQGWSEVTLTFDSACAAAGAGPGDFSVAVVPPGPAPTVSNVNVVGAAAVVTLNSVIPAGSWTCITHTPSGKKICLGSLPGDADGNRATVPSDILKLIDHLNAVAVPPLALDHCDMDRSSLCTPADILSLIDMLNGSGFVTWNGRGLPDCPSP